MGQTFTIPGRLPGMNEYTKACRTSPIVGAQMKRQNQEFVLLCIRSRHLFKENEPVVLHYVYYENSKRRDMDNVAAFAHKVVQDALVESGVLQGDGWKHVQGFTDRFFVDRLNPRIEVTILEAEP